MRYCLFSLLLFTASSFLSAQLPLTPAFEALLDSLDVRVNHPFNEGFRLRENPENDYLEDQLTVYSKAEKLEMRFHLRPESARDLYYKRPHLRTSLLVMNLGSNDEDAVTAVHSFGEEELAVLNADWATMWTFRPKRSYSDQSQAQLIAAYKEGRGLIYTVLLFDKVPETLEGRQMMLRFR
ncbi:hypothetical protein FUA23_20740 [Neolewinella aurantiaca]|uniref:Uncharacterized protein n=1 Tax=Neolewinella aurantiaca TaxID=2602767 RepID=A0A5C7F3M9_9BACT|nr:hypothetical protein [Neolewinella aurantiaca]TXF85232.1 hypothetical protein FUA23_20740 [Neolewinella aurantiaca]